MDGERRGLRLGMMHGWNKVRTHVNQGGCVESVRGGVNGKMKVTGGCEAE